MNETKEITAYQCGYCGTTYLSKQSADLCHAERTCSECGIVIGKNDYYTNCKSCRDKKEQLKLQLLIDKATKMTYDEYMKQFPNNPVVYCDEYFFYDYDYLMERIADNEDDNPIVWGSKKTTVLLDANSIIQNYEENVELEDYTISEKGVIEIVEFCNQWNKKYAQDVYYETTKILILINKEEI